MAGSNQAAWLMENKGNPLKVAEAPMPKPGPDEVVVKNAAVAINPVDWKVQDMGFFIEKFPNVLGTDSAGEIVEVGSNVINFKKGDRVMAHLQGLLTNDAAQGGFQLYSLSPAISVAKLPSNISYNEATVLPLAISTASAGLYQPAPFLGLPHPVVSASGSPQPTNKIIIVWGASSSVGSTVLQLAKASGVTTIATASTHNHDYVKSLGASEVYDYKSSSVIEDVVAAVKKSGKHFVGAYDSISGKDSVQACVKVLQQAGGDKRLATTMPGADQGLPDDIHAKSLIAFSIFGDHKDVGEAVWGRFVPEALKSGALKPVPEPLVAGKGLEHVQKAMQMNKDGVSAKKVIVEL